MDKIKHAADTIKRIQKVAAMTDNEIDYSDIPATTDFTGWYRRYDKRLFKPRKKSVSIRMDMDVLEWLKQHGNYNAFVNEICRQKMEESFKNN